MTYRHTQTSPAPLRIGVLAFLLVILAVTLAARAWAGAVVVAVTAAIVGTAMFVFSRITVEVTEERLQAFFGWGWPRRVLPWDQAASARIVRNRWWYGFGIRWFPGGTLWNVWGLDSVEFDLVSGSKLRIGTDEPEALLAAVSGRVTVG